MNRGNLLKKVSPKPFPKFFIRRVRLGQNAAGGVLSKPDTRVQTARKGVGKER